MKKYSEQLFFALIDTPNFVQSDVIVLLEGDGLNRVQHSCKIANYFNINTIFFSGGHTNIEGGSYPFSLCQAEFKQNDFKGDIIVDNESLNTYEQAVNFVKVLKLNNWMSFHLVASRYHHYRAYLTFLKVLIDEKLDNTIKMYSSPAELSWISENPWGKRLDLFESEIDKIHIYKKLGHISDYSEAIKYLEWILKN